MGISIKPKFTKLCDECVWVNRGTRREWWRCTHTKQSYTFCDIERKAGSSCGIEGKNWIGATTELIEKEYNSRFHLPRLKLPKHNWGWKVKWR